MLKLAEVKIYHITMSTVFKNTTFG